MGREIKRVSLDFNFPLGASYSQLKFSEHYKHCSAENHDKCAVEWKPPKGPGWQLWQTISDGPISPVFRTPDELIAYMTQPVPPLERKPWCPDPFPANPWNKGWSQKAAEVFVKNEGWLPSGVIVDGHVLTTDEVLSEDFSDEGLKATQDAVADEIVTRILTERQ